jgi:hypothetical protein
MTQRSLFRYFKTSPEIIRLAVMLYDRYPLCPLPEQRRTRSFHREQAKKGEKTLIRRSSSFAGLAALFLLGSGQDAQAISKLEFGPFTLALNGTLHTTALYGTNEGNTQLSSPNDLTAALGFLHQIGDLTFGFGLSIDVYYDIEAGPDALTVSDPGPAIYLKGPRFGMLAFNLTSSASGTNCVEEPSAGQNFAADQFVGMGTCPSFDSRSTFYYKTPDLGGGFSVALSYMPKFGQNVESGEAEEDASIALVYAATAADGAKWTASTGFERVLDVKGGGPTSDSWQAGVNRAKAGWTIGAAAAMTTFDQNAGKESALGIGVVRDLTDRWQASLGANWSNSTYDGADLTETSVALIASYGVIAKRLAVNFGLWQVETEDQGTTVQDTRLGTGLTFSF